MVQACPKCDHSNISHRRSQRPEWLCTNCGNEFDQPEERPPKNPGGGSTWHRQALIDADPDTVRDRRKA